MRKNVLIKVYDGNGNFKKAWSDATFVGFSKEINGGLGECVIELAREFDNYGEYSDVKLNNEIRILITDEDTDDTDEKYKRIYSGYISEYEPWIKGGKEGVIIKCLGYYTKLAQDTLKDGVNTTLYADTTAGLTTSSPGSAADIGLIMRAIIDRYIAETTSPKLHYSKATIPLSSTTGLYTFEMMTYREAIEVVKSLAPTDWWWYVNQWHEVIFKSKPTTPTHTFIFGRHFKGVRVKKSMEKIKNAMLFWNTKTDGTKIFKLYTDAGSILDYGRRLEKKIDQDRVGSSTDADKIGQGFVAEHKNPDIKVVIEILDNNENDKGYDIESIEPGDTCNFAGFDEKLDETFKENMLITKVDYTLDKAVLTIEPLKAGVVARQEQVAKFVDELATKGAPESYTT